jgi:putative nucleotidyltransferase with HDIG domain
MSKFLEHSRRLPSREGLLVGWVGLLASFATLAIGLLILGGYGLKDPVTLAVLTLVAVAAERESVKLTAYGEASIGSLVCVFAAVTLGPLAAALVGGAGVLVDLPRRDTARPVLRWLTWTSLRIIAGVAAAFAAVAVLRSSGNSLLVIFAAVFAAFTAETTADFALGSVAPVIRGVNSFTGAAKTYGPTLLGSVPLHAPMVAILAYSYVKVSPWSVALFMIPAVAAQRLHLLYRAQRETSEALTDANRRLASANLSFATALVATLDARDKYTAGHSAAVAIYARDIASRMGLSSREQELAHLCGLVHDIGKIGLPSGLLEKPGALTLEERRQMERHSEIGEGILKNVADYAEIADIVRHHHERVDGNGYPDALGGGDIPLLARIIAVADAYNAMTSDRPYRDAMPSRVARLRLAQAVEAQFDTSVVAAFEAILAGATEGYRLGIDPQFVLVHEALEAGEEAAPHQAPALDEDLRLVAASAALAV